MLLTIKEQKLLFSNKDTGAPWYKKGKKEGKMKCFHVSVSNNCIWWRVVTEHAMTHVTVANHEHCYDEDNDTEGARPSLQNESQHVQEDHDELVVKHERACGLG